jgi:hypothetical protein
VKLRPANLFESEKLLNHAEDPIYIVKIDISWTWEYFERDSPTKKCENMTRGGSFCLDYKARIVFLKF